MRLTISGYEVEIKAKGKYDERFNKDATMAILNEISLYASQAAKQQAREMEENTALWSKFSTNFKQTQVDNREQFAQDIFSTLEGLGYYGREEK